MRIDLTFTFINIVISKCDCLEGDSNFDYSEDIKKIWQPEFRSRLKGMAFSEIASRPKEIGGTHKLGYGLEKLLTSWTKAKKTSFEPILPTASTRFFDRYTFQPS